MSAEQRLWRHWRNERDGEAFEELVRPHLDFAHDLARRAGLDAADADDCVQRALFQLARERNDRPLSVGIRPWLGRAVKLQAKMLRRSNRRRQRRERKAAKPILRHERALERRDEVQAALATLGTDEREAVVLRYLHDFDYREIGFVLGITEVAARGRVHRALGKLRKTLGTTLPALLTLLAAAPPASAATKTALGAAAMSKTAKVAAGATLVLATLVTVHALRPATPAPDRVQRHVTAEETGSIDRRPEAPGSPPAPANAARPSAGPAGRPPTPAADPEALSAETVRTLITSGGAFNLMGSAPIAKPDGPAEPDPITRRYLDELAAEFHRQTDARKRTLTLRAFGVVHADYLRRTGDDGLLSFITGVVETGATAKERGTATGLLIAVDRPAVTAILARLLDSADDGARRHAAMGLASSRQESAWPAVRRALGHEDRIVRWNTVLGLASNPTPGPRVNEALLERLSRETAEDIAVLISRVLIQRKVDRTRFERAVRDAPKETRARLEREFASR